MEMAVESMEMAPGAIPCPGRVPEQRLLSPESCLRWRRRSGPVEEISNTVLGFLVWGYMQAKGRGRWHPEGPTSPPRAARSAAARARGGAASVAHFVSCSAFWNVPDEKLTSEKKSSNSENISLSTFLKPKTAENRELALWHLVNRLVPENA